MSSKKTIARILVLPRIVKSQGFAGDGAQQDLLDFLFRMPAASRGDARRSCFLHCETIMAVRDGMGELAQHGSQSRGREKLRKVPEAVHASAWSKQDAAVTANYKQRPLQPHWFGFGTLERKIALRTRAVGRAVCSQRTLLAEGLARQADGGAQL